MVFFCNKKTHLDNNSKKSSRSNLYLKTCKTGNPSTLQKTKNMKRRKEKPTVVDRLSDMPESLQLRILASLDARHAVQTSLLSKSWVSLWTCVPVINLCYDGFKTLDDFDNFVVNALSCRQPVKLDKLTFKRDGSCDVKILERVFDYASSHGVEELEANIGHNINHESWPINNASLDSLTSLKLESRIITRGSFLKGSFKNLTSLHLTRFWSEQNYVTGDKEIELDKSSKKSSNREIKPHRFTYLGRSRTRSPATIRSEIEGGEADMRFPIDHRTTAPAVSRVSFSICTVPVSTKPMVRSAILLGQLRPLAKQTG